MTDHYETQDEIERSLREITNIIDEAKGSDPEFYEELKGIFEAGTGQQRVVSCSHTITQGRNSEEGSWCVECGIKIYEVEDRECKGCKHFFSRPLNYSGCKKHLMAVTPDMHVTYKIAEGTCWTDSVPHPELF